MKKIASIMNDYNRQLCRCGHSVIFRPEKEFIICHHCGRKIVNKTKARFMREMWVKLSESKRVK